MANLRSRGLADSPALVEALVSLKNAKKELRLAIRRSKANSWDNLLRTVDADPWRKSYKIVLKKLGGSPPALNMDRCTLVRITEGLFQVNLLLVVSLILSRKYSCSQ